jgi:hypothetical protein
MLLSISQHALHGRPLRLRDRGATGVSLFPFFDGKGRTRAVMYTTQESGKIVLLRFRDGLFARGGPLLRFQPHRLDLHRVTLKDCSEEDARDVVHLWHFDPWWELAGERYQGHPAVPYLKGTNIPGFDAGITRVWFHKTLHRVTWVGTGEGEGMRVERFQPGHLAAAEGGRGEVSAAATSTGGAGGAAGWRLRPFWHDR